jgi:predicted acylesterase/phospholipase RssA
MSSSIIQRCKSLTLSFSGAGHLLPYHLGVAIALKENERDITQQINAVSGSSSGAIAASTFVYFTEEQIEEYAERFITDGGRAMFHFKQMSDVCKIPSTQQSLHIATTRCSDGLLHLFDFPTGSSLDQNKDKLVKCLEASCKIPHHFHPADLLPSKWPSTYPEEDGIIIDGNSFCDGGIAAPAPPTPIDNKEDVCRIIASPISGSNNEKNTIRISPRDDSWKFPMDIKCRGGFAVHPSLQNIKAMQVSAGVASTSILRKWYERGIEDAGRILSDE